jgi:hypothetical protein
MTLDALIIGMIEDTAGLSSLIKTFGGGVKLTKVFRGQIPLTYYDPVLKTKVNWDDSTMLPAVTYSQISAISKNHSIYTAYRYQFTIWHTTLGKARALGETVKTTFDGLYGADSSVKLISCNMINEMDYTSQVTGRFGLIQDYQIVLRNG